MRSKNTIIKKIDEYKSEKLKKPESSTDFLGWEDFGYNNGVLEALSWVLSWREELKFIYKEKKE